MPDDKRVRRTAPDFALIKKAEVKQAMLYLRYLRTLVKHKWYAFVECRKAGIAWQGFWHDMSKLRPDEFIPYARFYEGVRTPEVEEEFEKAWQLHISRNPHHWEAWIFNLSPQDVIGEVPIMMPWWWQEELICDYRAAGLAYNGLDDSREYYLKSWKKMNLDPATREVIEKELGITETDKCEQLRLEGM